jgi:DNA helicase-2/ATP-dependent DNA helicase PcrA
MRPSEPSVRDVTCAEVSDALDDKVLLLRGAPSQGRSFRVDYSSLLNPAQLEAVMHDEGPALVVAGAGSGKTRTLVYRVARLIESGVPPRAILMLTFTRRAAREMLSRVTQLTGERSRAVTGGTFHSFANSVLRRYGQAVGLPSNFSILDRGDMEDLINLLRGQMGFASRERRFPNKNSLAEVISMARNKGRSPEEELEADFPHLLDYAADIVRLATNYAKYKRERALFDYDDLLFVLAELLQGSAEVRCRVSDFFRYILVDEYQDTNPIQAELVSLLAATHQNVMAVGDDGQSIYSFRGADFRNILDFPRRFAGARIIRLEENYRSLQGILDLANEILGRARYKYSKTLFTRRTGDFRPLLVRAPDEHLQSRFVAQRILELREEGVELNEIAVLFRSSFHSFDLELELQRRDIPFVKRGGFKFIESAHIKDVLAHLRVIINPADAVSWLRVLTLLPGVGNRRAQLLVEALADVDDPRQALEAQAQETAGRQPNAAQGLKKLAALMVGLKRGLESPANQLAAVLDYYLPLMRDYYPDDYPRRERDLEHFQQIAQRYRSLQSMLTDMALEPPSDSVGGVLASDRQDECLTLSTIHSAKGLEWKVVFLIWAADGRFPPPQSIGDDELEEERRLMYVASTRARDELYIVYPIYVFERSMGYTMGQVSRFLEGIDPRILPCASLQEEPQD